MEIPVKYMLTDIIKSKTKDGKDYLRTILCDKEGARRNGIMFESDKLDFDPQNGNIVEAIGILQTYAGQDQLKINSMKLLTDADPADFLPKKGLDADAMFEELSTILIENINDEYLTKLVDAFLSDEDAVALFKKMPAAKSVHHAYLSGLLEHTLSIVKMAAMLGDFYKEMVNKEQLILGALFHDVGKIQELQAGTGLEYTDSGKLLGHLVLGVEILNVYISKIDGFPAETKFLLNHMILSHHGFLEFGSPKKPKTPEAFILHHLDDMDAKLNTFASIFEKEGVESGWSGYDRLLERQLYKHS
ncbi:metal dependent phosphohydrolase [Denitrovibrio acetiphilus DSM 12809]|uniref:Metal dependent phosphohydrolase n=1 Tax=Denitrovibrio acetiphilus (strain DSM 12809 / NBRC 114555 / N2460) TaxID=522772 RepID=D4H7V4_DENA2|nr:HD domain-containing protein [Denitrovibrio acetiphilus]ADD68103.1 metal dependent phosphohydrolase [Denitrovibrio acetiphilus DSM 12809]